MRPTIPFIVSLGVTALACDRSRDTTSAQAPIESKPSDKPSGTLLRIVCDIPDELGKPERSCPAYIGWSKDNITRGRVFTLPLGREIVELPLEHVIPLNERIHVRFVVEDDPPFETKFTSGDWNCDPQAHDASSTKVFSIGLSRFKKHDENKWKTMAPSEN